MDEISSSITKIPSDDILESFFKLRGRESGQLKTVLELYDMEINQKILMPKCQRLITMAKRSIDQKLQLRNFDARREKIETGAVVKNHKGLSGVENQWKEKGQCSKGDQCSFRHDSNDRPKSTPKAKPLSEPQSSTTRGRSVSRKKKCQKPV